MFNINFLDGSEREFESLRGTDLRNADLTCANLEDVDITGADLRNADLRWANLRCANLKDTNLTGADLSGANLRCVDLRDANLTDVNLTNADLMRATLRCVNFRDANLTGADFRHIDLRRANLTGANLRDVALQGADIYFTDIIGFYAGLHFGFAHFGSQYEDGSYVKIGCEGHSLPYWLENYAFIGKKYDYSTSEIAIYGIIIRSLLDIKERRELEK